MSFDLIIKKKWKNENKQNKIKGRKLLKNKTQPRAHIKRMKIYLPDDRTRRRCGRRYSTYRFIYTSEQAKMFKRDDRLRNI